MINIKVSGITEIKQLTQLDGLGIDFAGFIFLKDSPLCITGKIRPEGLKNVDVEIKKVGVFRNPEMIEVLDAIEDYSLDVVELNGDESPEMCGDLSSAVEVIKTFQVAKDGINIDELVEPYDDACDYYLFEGKGKSFDWSLLKKSRIEKPFFLSGDIGPGDIKKIKSFKHPDFFGIDINEHFEKTSGVKDMVSILQFKQGLKK
jgi:phosphoribosylanthranilate isomerase